MTEHETRDTRIANTTPTSIYRMTRGEVDDYIRQLRREGFHLAADAAWREWRDGRFGE